MTKPDQPLRETEQSAGAVIIKRAAIGVGGGTVLIFLTGMIAGYSTGAIDRAGTSAVDVAMLSGMIMALLAVGYAIWRFWPRLSAEPVAPRIKSARIIMILMGIMGVPLGVLLGLSDDGPASIFSNGPANPVVAIVAIGLWLIPVPALTWLWWQRVDEHEATAYRDGAFIAVHGYMFIAPAWWMATRAGWLPQQDPIIVLLVISVIWTIVWFAKRYL